MSLQRLMCSLALLLAPLVGAAQADHPVPFRGNWEGSTVSAELVEPGVVFVISAGTGEATHLGRFEMVAPHFTYLATLEVEGTMCFTAANGDELTATVSGQFVPNEDGSLEATLTCTITGGTGRFRRATGGYDFHIIARPAASGFGFDSTATFSGTISYR
jgi:hypothetical protein